MSNNIPDDVRSKIEYKYQTFLLEKLTEKDKEIDRLKKENNLFKAWNQMLKKRLEGMIKLTRKTRVAVKDEISKLKVENEKLKEHIEHLNGCLDSYQYP